MRLGTYLLAAVCAGTAGFAAVTAGPPGAPAGMPDPSLQVHAVTLNRGRVAISGLNTMPVRLALSASYPRTGNGGADAASLTVLLTHLPRRGTSQIGTLSVPVKRDGAAQSPGTWTGIANVPSTADGALRVTDVTTDPAHVDVGSMIEPTPFGGPTLQVTGVHRPIVTIRSIPRRPARTTPSYRIAGQVLDSATRKPYRSRVNVDLEIEGSCWKVCTQRTDAAGRYVYRVVNRPFGNPPMRPIQFAHAVLAKSLASDADGWRTPIAYGHLVLS